MKVIIVGFPHTDVSICDARDAQLHIVDSRQYVSNLALARRLLQEVGISNIQRFHVSTFFERAEKALMIFVESPKTISSISAHSDLSEEALSEIRSYKMYKKSVIEAKRLHAGQTYSALGLPYYYHLVQTEKVIDFFFDSLPTGKVMTLKTSSMLHDVIEDTDENMATIRARYGEEVADIVDKVTKYNEVPDKEYEEQYYRTISTNPLASYVKVADKCANAKQTIKTFSRWHADRILNGHAAFTEIVYRRISSDPVKNYLDSLVLRLRGVAC